MNPLVSPVHGIIKLVTSLFEKALCDLDRAALAGRVVTGANPLLWIAGHMTTTRFSMASMVGERIACPLPPVFAMGATVPEEAAMPDLNRVLGVWREISPVLLKRLAEATADQLAAPAPRRLPMEDCSVLGAITFLTYHEGYHLGQMALIRKGLGLPGLVDA